MNEQPKGIASRYDLQKVEQAAERVRVARTMAAARQDTVSAKELADALEAFDRARIGAGL